MYVAGTCGGQNRYLVFWNVVVSYDVAAGNSLSLGPQQQLLLLSILSGPKFILNLVFVYLSGGMCMPSRLKVQIPWNWSSRQLGTT